MPGKTVRPSKTSFSARDRTCVGRLFGISCRPSEMAAGRVIRYAKQKRYSRSFIDLRMPASSFQHLLINISSTVMLSSGLPIKKHIKISDLIDPKRWHDVLIVLEVDLLLLLLLGAVGHSAIDYQFLLAESLRLLLLNSTNNTLSLLSMLGRYSRYGSPVVNLITLFLSSHDSFFFFFFSTSKREISSSLMAIFLLRSGLLRSIS